MILDVTWARLNLGTRVALYACFYESSGSVDQGVCRNGRVKADMRHQQGWAEMIPQGWIVWFVVFNGVTICLWLCHPSLYPLNKNLKGLNQEKGRLAKAKRDLSVRSHRSHHSSYCSSTNIFSNDGVVTNVIAALIMIRGNIFLSEWGRTFMCRTGVTGQLVGQDGGCTKCRTWTPETRVCIGTKSCLWLGSSHCRLFLY